MVLGYIEGNGECRAGAVVVVADGVVADGEGEKLEYFLSDPAVPD